MAALLGRAGYRGTADADSAGVLIVNTCGFIQAAKEESIDILRELAESKRDDQLLIAAGCLAQRYGQMLVQEVPQIDGVIGTRRWMDIVPFVKKLRRRQHPVRGGPDGSLQLDRTTCASVWLFGSRRAR